jgi:2,3-bisphosphoglycerate-independent phosphoglycerate mutase
VALAGELSVGELVLHCFTDGRDTTPDSAAGFLDQLQTACRRAGVGRIATVTGRYWAMDRDNRWDRTQAAYDLLVHGRAEHRAADAADAIAAAYARGETDEFIAPTLVGAEGRIGQDDGVLCFNFRPDRMREIVRALAEPGLDGPQDALPGWRGRGGAPPRRRLATMTEYQHGWPYPVAFTAAHAPITLGAVLERAGLGQLHVAETEKYAHVTYFFDGGREQPYRGEERVLVPSQRDVPTYDLKPQMSAREVTTAVIDGFAHGGARFAVVNLANADMVGHTGVMTATIDAVEVVDESLDRITTAVHASGGVCVITADHGNAEQMLEPDDGPSTTHSCNLVPLIITAPDVRLAPAGTLADVAPTILALLGLDVPVQMSGHSLLR